MTPADPDYGIHNSRVPPEELLIFSILSRAILDLFGTVGLTSNVDEAKAAKHEALIFLTQETGGWEKRRRELCDAVGIDADDMRDRVIRVLEGDSLGLDHYDARHELGDVETARKQWEHEKGGADRAQHARLIAKKRRKPKQARALNTINKYSEVRPIIMGLLDRPRSFKDLITATNGDVSDTTIRKVLQIGIEKGDLVQPQTNTYLLASVPETAVAAAA